MKSSFISALLAASALVAVAAAPAQLQRSRSAQTAARQAAVREYFPLARGNQWTYRLSGSPFVQGERTVRVTDSMELDGRVYYRLEGFSPAPALVRLTPGGRFVALDEDSGAERLWLDFAAPQGGRWTPEGRGECFGAAAVAERNARVETPAGAFGNSVRIEYGPSICADAGVTREAYAPHVGPVAWSELTIAGPVDYELSHAVVDGRSIEARGLAFSLKIDTPVYVPESELIAPGETPMMTALMTLENTSDQPLTLRFASGQRFDIEIRDEAGETVYVWSADKVFPAVTGELELSPGVETWRARLPLQGFDGRELPPGRYVAEAWLTTAGSGRFAASVGFGIPEIVF